MQNEALDGELMAKSMHVAKNYQMQFKPRASNVSKGDQDDTVKNQLIFEQYIRRRGKCFKPIDLIMFVTLEILNKDKIKAKDPSN